ncbi:unnamed protein product, partial [Pylaiella littoralis]
DKLTTTPPTHPTRGRQTESKAAEAHKRSSNRLITSAFGRWWSVHSWGASDAGRFTARSAVPVVVLGACMTAVLYVNFTYLSNTLRSNHSHDTPPNAGTPVQDGHQSYTSGLITAERGLEVRGRGAVRAAETL